MKVFALLLCLLLHHENHALTEYPTSQVVLSGLNRNRYSAVVVPLSSGDALLDIVVSTSGISGEIVAATQDANGFFSELPVEPYRFLGATNERWFTDVAVADVNGDGLLDVIGCLARTGDNDLEAAVVAYLNDPASLFNETQILVPSTGFSSLNNGVWCHQVEVANDQILAVLSSGGAAPGILATMGGDIITDVFDVNSAVLKATDLESRPAAALLTGRSLLLMYSTESAGFETEERMLPDFGSKGPRDLAHADLDQDGQLDTVVIGSDLLFISYNISPRNWQDEVINLAPSPGRTSGWATVTVGDADGDGLPDILMSADFANGVQYLSRAADDNFGSLDQLQKIFDTGGKYHISADINKDGLNDILVRNGGNMVLYLGAEAPTEAPNDEPNDAPTDAPSTPLSPPPSVSPAPLDSSFSAILSVLLLSLILVY